MLRCSFFRCFFREKKLFVGECNLRMPDTAFRFQRCQAISSTTGPPALQPGVSRRMLLARALVAGCLLLFCVFLPFGRVGQRWPTGKHPPRGIFGARPRSLPEQTRCPEWIPTHAKLQSWKKCYVPLFP